MPSPKPDKHSHTAASHCARTPLPLIKMATPPSPHPTAGDYGQKILHIRGLQSPRRYIIVQIKLLDAETEPPVSVLRQYFWQLAHIRHRRLWRPAAKPDGPTWGLKHEGLGGCEARKQPGGAIENRPPHQPAFDKMKNSALCGGRAAKNGK